MGLAPLITAVVVFLNITELCLIQQEFIACYILVIFITRKQQRARNVVAAFTTKFD